MNETERLREKFEGQLMTIPGVVGVGSGVDAAGRTRLKVYTSEPPGQVRSRLPPELREADLDLEYVGTPEAQ